MQENKGESKQGGLSWTTPAQSPMPVQSAQGRPASGGKPEYTTPKAQTLPPKPASDSKKYIGMIVLGIIAGVIIAWGWSAVRAPKESASTNTSSTNLDAAASKTTSSASSSGLGLTIVSPQVAGNSVVVAKAVVSSPTWIVIYEDNNGKPGNALGAALFFPETQTGTVELLRGTTAGKSYLATEQVDNGDHKFSLKDDQFLSVNGAPQWIPFEVK